MNTSAGITLTPNPHAALPDVVRATHADTSTPSQPARSTGSGDQSVSDLILGLLLSGAVIAAVVNIVLTRRKSLEDERTRLRNTCAEAFEAVAAYKEFPYAIRRRRKDTPEAERVRLSDELRHIQERLSYYTAWMRAEDAALATAFDELVTNLRRIAGTACHDAWKVAAINSDADMNIPPGIVDLSGLIQHESAYIVAVKTHLDGLIKTRRLLKKPRRPTAVP